MDKAMIQQAMQEAEDEKMRKKAGKRYDELSSVAPSAPPRDAVRGQRGYKKGGGVTRADGCVSKGHTKGKMV
jgi:hypothetical protein